MMTDENYMESGLDIASARQRFLGNRALFEKFLFRFPEDQNYKKMVESVKNGDVEEAFNAAHTLKGVCGNLSLKKLYDKVSEVTEVFRKGEFPEEAQMASLEEIYLETLGFLESVKENGIPEF